MKPRTIHGLVAAIVASIALHFVPSSGGLFQGSDPGQMPGIPQVGLPAGGGYQVPGTQTEQLDEIIDTLDVIERHTGKMSARDWVPQANMQGGAIIPQQRPPTRLMQQPQPGAYSGIEPPHTPPRRITIPVIPN